MLVLLFVVCGIIAMLCEIASWKMSYDEQCEKKERVEKQAAT